MPLDKLKLPNIRGWTRETHAAAADTILMAFQGTPEEYKAACDHYEQELAAAKLRASSPGSPSSPRSDG
jgi:hypothetical protein